MGFVEEKLNKILEILNEHSKILNEHSKKFDYLDNKIGYLDNKIDKAFENIDILSIKTEENNQMLRSLLEANDIHKAELDSQGNRITKIEGTLNALKKAL